jgi:glutamine synthetase
LIIGAAYLTMLDGIRAVLDAGKTPRELEVSISKRYGDEDFYLETGREYRSERTIYTDYTAEERERLFGRAPSNVWECFKAWGTDGYDPEAVRLITCGDETLEKILRSYREQMIYKWTMEYHDRYIENTLDVLRGCVRMHTDDANEYDHDNWQKISYLRNLIGHEEKGRPSLLMQARTAIDEVSYEELSRLEIEIEERLEELRTIYNQYRRNIF